MPTRRTAVSRSAPAAEPARGAEALLVPLGLLLAMALPFVVVSTMSDQAHLETKLFAQAAAAALAMIGVALPTERGGSGRPIPGVLRVAGFAALGALALSLVSAAVNLPLVDPLVALAFLSPAALFLAGASAEARSATPRILGLVGACGAATGLLAFGQRFLALPRLPLETPQDRFLATGLIGNPGELAAALVVPALILWGRALEEGRPALERRLAAAGFLCCALGLGAAETITPIVATGCGLAAHAFLAPRRRALALVAVIAAGAAVMAATGAGGRLLQKVQELRTGQIADALTQRDIGLAAGAEMVSRAPLLGLGPGGFESAFVPARLAAERRARHRFVHRSEASHFENAHCEPLTFAAENGIPAAFLSLVAFGALLLAVGRRADPTLRDALFPALLAFFVLSLGSFPLRMPASSGAFALCAGLAWRGAGGGLPLPHAPGARRSVTGAVAVLLLLTGGARLLAALWEARGEAVLRQAAIATEARTDILAEARAALSRAVLFRPRRAAAWVALGSCDRLSGDAAKAWDRTARSFALEERAETDFDLGLLAFERGDRAIAHDLFVRAVWLLPVLAGALEDEHAPGSVELDVSDAEARVASGGDGPPLPPSVDRLRLRHRFP